MRDDFECAKCDCFDHDYGSCTMPSCDKIYACPLEGGEDEDDVKEVEKEVRA